MLIQFPQLSPPFDHILPRSEREGNTAQKGSEIIPYEIFKGKVAEQKQVRKLNYEQIGKMAGYSKNAIAQFMCGKKESERVAKAIAQALDIEM